MAAIHSMFSALGIRVKPVTGLIEVETSSIL